MNLVFVFKILNNKPVLFFIALVFITCELLTGLALSEKNYENNQFIATDKKNMIQWQKGQSELEISITKGNKYCESLTLGKKSDWRLPSLKDFTNLLGGCDSHVPDNFGRCHSCGAVEKCNNYFPEDKKYYWSSTSQPKRAGSSYFVGLGTGTVGFEYNSEEMYIKCIRTLEKEEKK